MQEFLTSEPLNAIVLLSPVFGVMVFLVLLIIRQRRQISKLEKDLKPKYGFLGKPLYSIMALAVLSLALGISVWSTRQPSDVTTVSATVEVGVIVNYNVGNKVGENYEVTFYAWPTINGERWGKTGADEFDIFWEGSGPTDFSEVEFRVSEENASGYTKQLKPGNYDVLVSVFHPEDDFDITVKVTIP